MVCEKSCDYNLESLIGEIGQFGRFQLFNYVLICVPIMFNAISTLSYVFTASSVVHRCKIPGCDTEESVYYDYWTNFTMPIIDGTISKCTRYPSVTNESDPIENFCSKTNFDNSKEESCNNFVFRDNNEFSISNEWGIFCSDEWKLSMVGTANNVGQFIGIPLGGFVSDRYGRRTALALGGSLSALMGIIRSLAPDYNVFVLFEFLDSVLGSVLYSAVWILGIELVGPKKRVLACSVLTMFYAVGEVLLGLVAKYEQNWRTLLQILYPPALIHIIYFWILPESVRWLLSQGRSDEAIEILQRAASVNKKTISESSLKKLQKSSDLQEDIKPQQKVFPFKEAFQSPKMFWRIVNCSFCWFTNVLVYYGLSLNSVLLGGDKYNNFIFVSLVEVPGFVITYLIMDRIGRRYSLFGSLLVSGASCAASIFIQHDQYAWALTLFLVGKLAITVSFQVLYFYTAEIFPTSIRHSLLSFCSMFGRIGSMLAPQTPLMAKFFTPLPLILFSVCAVLSGCLALYFPETKEIILPSTLHEAETIGQHNKENEITKL